MSERIEDLLHRRTDLSTFLVHFTRDSDDGATISQDNLLKILKTGRLEARNSYGMAMRLAERFPEVAKTQQAVCFTETPIEHAWMMCRQIADRSTKISTSLEVSLRTRSTSQPTVYGERLCRFTEPGPVVRRQRVACRAGPGFAGGLVSVAAVRRQAGRLARLTSCPGAD